MFVLKRNNINLSKNDLKLIIFYLQKGKILVLPTDTIYGLSCVASNKASLERLTALKKRSREKPYIHLVSSLNMAKKYATVSKWQETKLKYYWQESKRPVTVILSAKYKSSMLTSTDEYSLSLRLPKSQLLIKIIKGIGEPLVSTSLNLSGQEPIAHVSNLAKIFRNQDVPVLVLDTGPCFRIRPSKIIDLRNNLEEIIRK